MKDLLEKESDNKTKVGDAARSNDENLLKALLGNKL